MKATVAVLATLLTACTSTQTDGSPPPAAESGSLVSVSPAKSVRAPRTSRSLNTRPAVSATPRALPTPRRTPPPRRSLPVGFTAWRHSATALRVLACESHGNYSDMSHHAGTIYYGAWQANAAFWRTYGGDPRYLADRSRFTAPAWMQDAVAYRGWLTRGWSAWACA